MSLQYGSVRDTVQAGDSSLGATRENIMARRHLLSFVECRPVVLIRNNNFAAIESYFTSRSIVFYIRYDFGTLPHRHKPD